MHVLAPLLQRIPSQTMTSSPIAVSVRSPAGAAGTAGVVETRAVAADEGVVAAGAPGGAR